MAVALHMPASSVCSAAANCACVYEQATLGLCFMPTHFHQYIIANQGQSLSSGATLAFCSKLYLAYLLTAGSVMKLLPVAGASRQGPQADCQW